MKRLTLSVSMQPVGDGKIIPPIATVAADDGFSGREVLGSELSKKGSGRLSLFAAPSSPATTPGKLPSTLAIPAAVRRAASRFTRNSNWRV